MARLCAFDTGDESYIMLYTYIHIYIYRVKVIERSTGGFEAARGCTIQMLV
jgi:hypothetical protein